MTEKFGLETPYGGSLFRSRLEAQWAAFFDLIGWGWDYEPPISPPEWKYIPDFLIQGDRPMLVEVRPVTTPEEYRLQIPTMNIDPRVCQLDLLILGLHPVAVVHSFYDRLAAGLMGERWGDVIPNQPSRVWAPALWHRCERCGSISVHHEIQDYAGRPCNHHDGDHLLGWVDEEELVKPWREAGRAIRWTPK